MNASSTIYKELLALVRELDLDSQLRLLEELAALVRQQVVTQPKHSILELQGLGKEIWQGIDPQKYVERERAAWSIILSCPCLFGRISWSNDGMP